MSPLSTESLSNIIASILQMDPIIFGLNDAQKTAVTSPASVLQVLAPPGSGKTKTLTARVAYLIAHRNVKPWDIIVCTFTIKAAREMKERIRNFVGASLESKLLLGTFHSISRRFLVSYGQHIGIPKNFGIADSADQLAIIKRIIKRGGYNIEPSVARSRISKRKARDSTSELSKDKSVEKQEFESVFAEYEDVLKASNLLDYDDLLLRCVDLLRQHPACVSNIEAVLIDEFQDTNVVQYELMSLFAQRQHKITIVGDPDQSIYSFRNAEVKNLTRMTKHWPDTQVVLLQENYRSSGAILQSSLTVIEQDTSRPAKPLLATHCVGERPILRRLPSAPAEAAWLVVEIQRSKALTGQLFTFSDYAILLRSASLSRHIESALGRNGIPYRMVGGHKFFDRIEVKILLDYLRVINQPDHNDALVRVINVPPRKIGDPTVKALIEEAETKKIPLWNLVLDAAQGNRRPVTKLSSQAYKGIEIFVNIILTSRKKLLSQEGPPCQVIDLVYHIINKLSFEDFLKKSHAEDFEARWANVEELIIQASDVSAAMAEGRALDEDALPVVEDLEQRTMSSAEDCLGRFLANVALATDAQGDKGGEPVEQVTISTIHAAKGLEWPVVFIPAAYEGSIPHSRAEDCDEERRLLYVGMTRAQSLLYLSCPNRNSSNEQTTLSPFLSPLSMSPFFDARGPSFKYRIAQDLARILHRECPPEIALLEAMTKLDRLEDDFWPLNGEENDAESNRWDYSKNNDSYDGGGAYPQPSNAKRRRLETASSSKFIGTTSMLVPEGYSISNTTIPPTGFVSAAARMKEQEQQEASRKVTEAIKEKDMKKQERQVTLKRATKQPKAGQGSLLSFFGKSGTVATTSGTISSGMARLNSAKTIPLDDISTFMANKLDNPVRSVEQSLELSHATHKVRKAPLLNRPPKLQHEEAANRKTYVLLSSSPVKPENDDNAVKIESPTRKAPAATSSGNPKVRPATTFHTTSMAQLHDREQSAPRRTLGMRGPLKGWSAQPNTPFNKPGKPK